MCRWRTCTWDEPHTFLVTQTTSRHFYLALIDHWGVFRVITYTNAASSHRDQNPLGSLLDCIRKPFSYFSGGPITSQFPLILEVFTHLYKDFSLHYLYISLEKQSLGLKFIVKLMLGRAGYHLSRSHMQPSNLFVITSKLDPYRMRKHLSYRPVRDLFQPLTSVCVLVSSNVYAHFSFIYLRASVAYVHGKIGFAVILTWFQAHLHRPFVRIC